MVITSTVGPLTWGRAAAKALSQGGGHRRSASPDVRQVGSVEPRPAPPMRSRELRRAAARDLLVVGLVGGSFFL
jgi:hypothetical protein